MRKFKDYMNEASEYIQNLKKRESDEANLKTQGYKKTGERKGEDSTTTDFAKSKPDGDGTTTNKYIRSKVDNQTGKIKNAESTYVKTKPLPNGIERKRLHQRDHANKASAAKHLSDIDKHHNDKK